MRTAAPQPPAGFWEHPPLADALAAREMGAVIREYRRHPWHGRRCLAQGQIATWGGVTQGQLSRLENGISKVRDLDRLIAWAQALKIPGHLLWFSIPDALDERPPTSRRTVRALAPSLAGASAEPYVAAQTLKLVREYAATDNLLGPRFLLRPVASQLRYVDQLLSDTRREDATHDLLRAAARTAELLGWLYQDVGDLRSAMRVTDRALRYSHELGDKQLESYVLMRQATMASDAGDADRSLALCAGALWNSYALTPRLRAVALRQKATAHTLRHDTAQVMACIDQAEQQLSTIDDPGSDPSADLTAYVTPEYLDMEAAACLVHLDHGDRAVRTIERGLSTWRPEFRRELGVCLARASIAYIAVQDPDQAQAAAEQALRLAGETHSARTIRELRRARRAMTARGLSEPARELDDGLRVLQDAQAASGGKARHRELDHHGHLDR